MQIAARSSDRVIDVSWGNAKADKASQPVYPVDVSVQAADRHGLLKDISEVFSASKVNVIGVQTQSVKGNGGSTAWMTFTAEVSDTSKLISVMATIRKVTGVRVCTRR
jgi:GTP pyrophosphokinase